MMKPMQQSLTTNNQPGAVVVAANMPSLPLSVRIKKEVPAIKDMPREQAEQGVRDTLIAILGAYFGIPDGGSALILPELMSVIATNEQYKKLRVPELRLAFRLAATDSLMDLDKGALTAWYQRVTVVQFCKVLNAYLTHSAAEFRRHREVEEAQKLLPSPDLREKQVLAAKLEAQLLMAKWEKGIDVPDTWAKIPLFQAKELLEWHKETLEPFKRPAFNYVCQNFTAQTAAEAHGSGFDVVLWEIECRDGLAEDPQRDWRYQAARKAAVWMWASAQKEKGQP